MLSLNLVQNIEKLNNGIKSSLSEARETIPRIARSKNKKIHPRDDRAELKKEIDRKKETNKEGQNWIENTELLMKKKLVNSLWKNQLWKNGNEARQHRKFLKYGEKIKKKVTIIMYNQNLQSRNGLVAKIIWITFQPWPLWNLRYPKN